MSTMTNPIAQVSVIYFRPEGEEESVPAYREVRVNCPGCQSMHHFTVEILDSRYTRHNGSPEPTWSWDGNLEKPTFSPSMLAYSSVHLCKDEHQYAECDGNCDQLGHSLMWKLPDGSLETRWYKQSAPEGAVEVKAHDVTGHTKAPAWGNCHSFLTNGVWQFLSDCAHVHAGESMPVIPLADWMVRE